MEYTETERQILDMWPKFEDGEYVMYEDKFDFDGEVKTAYGFNFGVGGRVSICSDKWSHVRLPNGERVKRPAPKVLDADGVEVKVDDTVWLKDGTELLVEEVNRYGARCFDGEIRRTLDPKSLTYTQPDSWERIEKDAESIRQIIAYNFGDFSPSDFKQSGDSLQDRVSDLVRRAKAIAEKEAKK